MRKVGYKVIVYRHVRFYIPWAGNSSLTGKQELRTYPPKSVFPWQLHVQVCIGAQFHCVSCRHTRLSVRPSARMDCWAAFVLCSPYFVLKHIVYWDVTWYPEIDTPGNVRNRYGLNGPITTQFLYSLKLFVLGLKILKNRHHVHCTKFGKKSQSLIRRKDRR